MATRSRGSSASTHRAIPPGRPPRGATAVLVAIVLVLLLGFLALALDSGHLFSVRGELQNAVDSGALAGAADLDGTPDGLAPAIASGTSFAARHETDSHVDVVANQVELGHWTPPDQVCSTFSGVANGQKGPDGYQFCRIDARDAAAARDINAVRVQAARAKDAPGGGGAPVFLHPFLGHAATADVAAEAVAVSGSPCEENCPELPFAIKQSCVENGGVVSCENGQPILFYVGLAASGIDSAGMTIFKEAACGDATGTDTKYNGSSGWGTGDVCDILSDKCAYHPVVGKCISIKNGDSVAGNCPSLGEKICNALRDRVGRVAQVPLVQYAEGENCAGGFADFNYTHAAKVVGIGSVRLVGAQCLTGSEKGIVAMPGYEAVVSQCQFASGSCFVLEFVCHQRDDDETTLGCNWTGTSPLRPALVR